MRVWHNFKRKRRLELPGIYEEREEGVRRKGGSCGEGAFHSNAGLLSSTTALPAGRATRKFAEAHTAREEDERVGEIESQKMKLMRQWELMFCFC